MMSCFAVGGSLTERWNGKGWSIVAVPAKAGSLESVPCTSSTSCFTVGVSHSLTPGRSTTPRSHARDGKSWSVVPSPTPTLGDGGPLQSVSCIEHVELHGRRLLPPRQVLQDRPRCWSTGMANGGRSSPTRTRPVPTAGC